ncbi:hypothetical protein [Chitinophaga japonensis]|uniref:Uncharacterized protein n=1 Tax=Chitinophaga japonensis TaxID=104662 RepID=A0A562SI65_CHIJA|nr:hypothetical protein [Chitinophaga japonensis]TWI80977.1 hypothetical protein LX66_5582 [Chitinophaga japonensis]
MLNYAIVKSLVKKHLQIQEQINLLAFAGVQVDMLDQLDLFDIALDVIGFPKDTPINPDADEPLTHIPFSRDKWDFALYELREQDVDAFVKQLYKEYDELILEQPHLFVRE